MPFTILPIAHRIDASTTEPGWTFRGPWTADGRRQIETQLTQWDMKGSSPRDDSWIFTVGPGEAGHTVYSAWQPSAIEPPRGYVAERAADLANDLWQHYFEHSLDADFQARLHALVAALPPVPADHEPPAPSINAPALPDPFESWIEAQHTQQRIQAHYDVARQLLADGDAEAARRQLDLVHDTAHQLMWHTQIQFFELYGDVCVALEAYDAAHHAYGRAMFSFVPRPPGSLEDIQRGRIMYFHTMSARLKQAHLARMLGDLDAATMHVRDIVRICDALAADSPSKSWIAMIVAEALVVSVDVLFRQAQPAPAVQTAERARSILMRNGRRFPLVQIATLANLAIILDRHGACTISQPLAKRVLALAHKHISAQETRLADTLLRLKQIAGPPTGTKRARQQRAWAPLPHAALAAALQVEDAQQQAEAVRSVIPYLDEEYRNTLQTTLATHRNPLLVAWGLTMLDRLDPDRVPATMFTHCWTTLARDANMQQRPTNLEWIDQWDTIAALIALRPHLAPTAAQSTDAWLAALATDFLAWNAPYMPDELMAGIALLPYLSAEQQEQLRTRLTTVITRALQQQDGGMTFAHPDQTMSLVHALATVDMAGLVEASVAALPAAAWSASTVWVVLALLPHGYGQSFIARVLAVSEHAQFQAPYDHWQVRADLLLYVTLSMQMDTTEQLILWITYCQEQGIHAGWMAPLMIRMAAFLDAHQATELLVYAKRLPRKRDRSRSMIALLPRLDAIDHEHVIDEIRRLANQMHNHADQAYVLAHLLQVLRHHQ